MSLASLFSEMWQARDVEWSFSFVCARIIIVAGVQGLHRARAAFSALNQPVTHHCLPVRGISATTYSEMQQIYL